MERLEWMQQIKARPCAVLGLGISNLPLVEFLLSHGARVTVHDKKTREMLGEIANGLEARGVRLVLGEEYLSQIEPGLIFRSPGLRPDMPPIREALQKGACLTSEMELFLDLTPATVIGITGSDGKTTTTTLTGLMLETECRKRGGRTYVGGNIGEPLLPLVEQMTASDFAVVELSSFQLQTVKRSPMRAALTNVTPNHLNWHTGMEEYVEAKTQIFRHAPNQMLVTNAENEITVRLARRCGRAVTYFSSVRTSASEFAPLLKAGDRAVYARRGEIVLWDGEAEHPILTQDRIRLPGKHNLENYMTAIALTWGLVSRASVAEVADRFTGVRHRLEPVRVVDGVQYYNSSIDSTPARTAAALSALSQKPIVICGGSDKHISFAPLAETLYARAKAVVLTGETAKKIGQALQEHPCAAQNLLPIYTEETFEAAVRRCREIAVASDIVLLSPACASFDAFRNFEERGNRFCEIVNNF